jgi:hypothetical protein
LNSQKRRAPRLAEVPTLAVDRLGDAKSMTADVRENGKEEAITCDGLLLLNLFGNYFKRFHIGCGFRVGSRRELESGTNGVVSTRLRVFGKNVLEVSFSAAIAVIAWLTPVPISEAFRQIQRRPEPSRFGEVENALCLVFGLANLPASATLRRHLCLGLGKPVIGKASEQPARDGIGKSVG